MTILKFHGGIGPKVRGIALVANDDFSARYDLDRTKGIFSRPDHKLYGQSYAGRILVFNTAKGGVASAWMLREIAQSPYAPIGYLFNRANTILAQGAAFAETTLCDRFEDGDVIQLIPPDAEILVDPESGAVTIL